MALKVERLVGEAGFLWKKGGLSLNALDICECMWMHGVCISGAWWEKIAVIDVRMIESYVKLREILKKMG
ncbi:MAG: hypothetical protein ACXACA_06980 [Candidatus Ranarchaeia archaeon]|jgi:hypothetical protein